VTEPSARLAHITVTGRVQDQDFHRRGGGDARIRDVERRDLGAKLRGDLASALTEADHQREVILEELTLEELAALGVIIVLEAADDAFPLDLDRLDRRSAHRKTPTKPKWLLLSASPGSSEAPEQAVVWVSDDYRAAFLKFFEDYLSRDSASGQPKNRALVANIASIRRAVLADLWQSDGTPPAMGRVWWELWLRPSEGNVATLRRFTAALQLPMASRHLQLSDRTIAWVQARWEDLQALPFTSVPIAEIRRPEFVDTVEDLSVADQQDLASDLEDRTRAAAEDAPVVCHLDSGIRHSHALISASLAAADVHSVVDSDGADRRGHGTYMAGLSLYGPLDELLTSSKTVTLTHRLESVKILPDEPSQNDPQAYGLITAQGAAAAEAARPGRPRVFCLPITSQPEATSGEPSLWSASIDALCVGTDIGQADNGIALLGKPDPAAARLFVISAGNVREHVVVDDYRDLCDTSIVEDPANSWNALTVGAHTHLTDLPSDPSFEGWGVLAPDGDLSPHSRTSALFGARGWPIKPDICMEGGNVLSNGTDFHERHPLLSLRTTGHNDDLAIGSANATSAATAQAAGLAAAAMATYPDYWPETIRGLLVHAAEWTPAMLAEVRGASSKTARQQLLRRYGWGVPSTEAVLGSRASSVTLVTQDVFVPFAGPEHAARRFRLHQLPWPTDVLRELGAASVQLRVTLSYFVEPSASRRGWRRRYAYGSHGLRFELKAPLEQQDDFLARVNREAQDEEAGQRPSSGSDRWFIGDRQRNLGSLHQDLWEGTGSELAECDLIAVNPIGGWWKNNKRADRTELPLRYSLMVSLRTDATDVDLYTPISTQLRIPIATEIVTS
jgi:hypothetical protein